MAASLVQAITKVAGSATSTNITLGTGGTTNTGTAATSGNTVLVYAGAPQSGGRTCSVSDGTNGSYTQDRFSNVRATCGIYSFNNIVGGNLTVTATVSGAATTVALTVEEWSGILIPSPFDKGGAANNINGSGNVTSSATGTLSQAAELAVAVCMTNTSQAGALAIVSPFSPSSGNGVNNVITAGNYQPNSTASLTVTFNLPVTSNYEMQLATYKLTTVVTPPLFAQRYQLYYT